MPIIELVLGMAQGIAVDAVPADLKHFSEAPQAILDSAARHGRAVDMTAVAVAGVGVVPKEHPDVGGILARRGVPPVCPSPDLEKGQGWQRGDVDGNPPGSLTATAVARASVRPATLMTSAPSVGQAMLRSGRSTPPKGMMSRR